MGYFVEHVLSDWKLESVDGEVGGLASVGDRGGASKDGEGGRSWARVVQGPSKQPSWTHHRILNEEIDDLHCYFSKVLKFPKTIMDESWWQWEKLAVFVQSLGWKVPIDWVFKEVRMKMKFNYDSKIFSHC